MGFQETFKALADPTRRKILELLKPKRLAAGEIVDHFDVSNATISRHLSVLKQANLVTDFKEGKYVFYELNVSVVEEAMKWLAAVMEKGDKDE